MNQDTSDADTAFYEVRDGVATVKINWPGIRNAQSPAAANLPCDLWGEVNADKNTRVDILCSGRLRQLWRRAGPARSGARKEVKGASTS